jgi:hypothetical protein
MSLDESIKALISYRLESAREKLSAAEDLLEKRHYKDSVSRLRIPAQAATRFRFIPPPESDSSRHPIPIHSAMGIRSIPPPPGRG